MHVFIDANILVGFFELKSDGLDDLEKLIAVTKGDTATLWLPEQAKREFWKNRENNIKNLVRGFEQHNALGNPPLLVRENPKFVELRKNATQVDELRREIAAEIKGEVDQQKTHADKIIRNLFGSATPIDTDEEKIFSTALRRAQCHLPPGKKDELGDRLNWVALLSKLPSKADLHIVSDDSDFRNEGFTDEIRPYLKWEWNQKNGGTVRLWGRVSQFLAANFPDAQNAMEMERGILAQRLLDSRSFAQTHETIADLKELGGFNNEHLRIIAEAIVVNDQVRYISDDPDVHAFYTDILTKYGTGLDEDLRTKIGEFIKGRD